MLIGENHVDKYNKNRQNNISFILASYINIHKCLDNIKLIKTTKCYFKKTKITSIHS